MTEKNEPALVLRTMAESYRLLAMSCDRAAEMIEEAEAKKSSRSEIEPQIKYQDKK